MASGSAFTLDFKPSYTPKSIREFLGEIHFIGDQRRRITRLEEYVNSLEEEQRKVDAFKRELPLCMLLLSDAIEALREEEMKWRKPVLEEFMSPVMSKTDGVKMEKDKRDKMNWMSSVQLWGNINNNDNNNNNNDYNNNYKKNEASDVKEKKDKESEGYLIAGCKKSNQGGAFMPFKGFLSSRKEEKVFPFPNLSLLSPGINTPSAELGADGGLNSNGICKGLGSSMASGQANLQPRKSRRCWSPELHRRFVNALHQLGGPQVATPKQIRELMKVDGLTNDEVKSHLQKYRLHTRRVPGTAAAAAHKQVVVLGGMWVPHDHYQASKEGDSQSSSPKSPLHWTGTAQGIYNDDYEEDDAESEFYLERPHSSFKQGRQSDGNQYIE